MVTFFDFDTNDLRMMEFKHLIMEGVDMTIPNVDSATPSSRVVEQILGCWAEGGIDLPVNQEPSR